MVYKYVLRAKTNVLRKGEIFRSGPKVNFPFSHLIHPLCTNQFTFWAFLLRFCIPTDLSC